MLLFLQDTAYHLRGCDCDLTGCRYRTHSSLHTKRRRRVHNGNDNSSTHNSTAHMFICRYKTVTDRAPGGRWPLPARRGCIGRRSLLGDRPGYSQEKWDRRGFGDRSLVLYRDLQHAFRRNRRRGFYGCVQKEYEIRGGDRLSRRSAGKSQQNDVRRRGNEL